MNAVTVSYIVKVIVHLIANKALEVYKFLGR